MSDCELLAGCIFFNNCLHSFFEHPEGEADDIHCHQGDDGTRRHIAEMDTDVQETIQVDEDNNASDDTAKKPVEFPHDFFFIFHPVSR